MTEPMTAEHCIVRGSNTDYPTCICGASMEWVDCFAWGCEDGYVNRYDDDPLWYDEDDYEVCNMCYGKGGWWQCVRTMSE